MCATCRERGIGELYVEGDEACEQNDLVTLARVAEHVSEHFAEPLHCELAALARECREPTTAAAAWDQLKKRLQGATVQQ